MTDAENCWRCGEPVLPGEPRFGAAHMKGKVEHWKCREKHLDALEADIKEVAPDLADRFINILRGRKAKS